MAFGIGSALKRGFKKVKKGVKKGVKKVGNFAGDIADKTKNIPGLNAFTSQLALLDSPSDFAKIWKNNILPQYAVGGAGALGAMGLGALGGLGGAAGGGAPIAGGIGGGSSAAGGGGVLGSLGGLLGGNAGGALGSILGGALGYTSSKDIKSTSVQDLPKWQKDHVQRALGGARGLYETGMISQVAPLSQQTTGAIDALTSADATDPYKRIQAYLQGTLDNPKASVSGDYYKDVLGGKFLDGNPYLDGVIGRAQDDVQSRVDSQFASGGRFNSGAAQRALATGLGDVSRDMRYADYNNERGRMGEAAAGLTGIDQFGQNYGLQAANAIGNQQDSVLRAQTAALGAGGVLDAYNQRLLDNPYEAVQRYLASSSGNYGGTSSSSQPQNKTLNTLAGITGGYSLGQSLFGGGSSAPANIYDPSKFNLGGSSVNLNGGNPNGLFSGGSFGY